MGSGGAYTKMGDSTDVKFLDPNKAYGNAQGTLSNYLARTGGYNTSMLAYLSNMTSAANLDALGNTTYTGGKSLGTALAGAIPTYGDVTTTLSASPIIGFNPKPIDVTPWGKDAFALTKASTSYSPDTYFNEFYNTQADKLRGLAMGATSPLEQGMNARAGRLAKTGSEAALAALGGRNSGAGMAAFGEAYANPFSDAALQLNQQQLGLTGNLWNQAMGLGAQGQQFKAGLQSSEALANAARAMDYNKYVSETEAGNQARGLQASGLNLEALLANQRNREAYSALELQKALANQQSELDYGKAASENYRTIADVMQAQDSRRATSAYQAANLNSQMAGQGLTSATQLAQLGSDFWQPSYVPDMSDFAKTIAGANTATSAVSVILKALTEK